MIVADSRYPRTGADTAEISRVSVPVDLACQRMGELQSQKKGADVLVAVATMKHDVGNVTLFVMTEDGMAIRALGAFKQVEPGIALEKVEAPKDDLGRPDRRGNNKVVAGGDAETHGHFGDVVRQSAELAGSYLRLRGKPDGNALAGGDRLHDDRVGRKCFDAVLVEEVSGWSPGDVAQRHQLLVRRHGVAAEKLGCSLDVRRKRDRHVDGQLACTFRALDRVRDRVESDRKPHREAALQTLNPVQLAAQGHHVVIRPRSEDRLSVRVDHERVLPARVFRQRVSVSARTTSQRLKPLASVRMNRKQLPSQPMS
jgi:hypothetical protein